MLELEELFATVIVPEKFPVVVGLTFTMKNVFLPGSSVIGEVLPDIEKPEPTSEIFEIVKGPVPTLVIDTSCPTFCPTPTPPYAMPDGVTDITGWPAVVPVPDSAIPVTDGFVFAVIEMLPGKAPAVVGANLATIEVLAPVASVTGSVTPVTV